MYCSRKQNGGVISYHNQDFLNERTTIVEDNVIKDLGRSEASLTTLERICDEYISDGQQISFLKIDVEGYEKQVLLGANLQKYRPIIIVIEAVSPIDNRPTYKEWEYILFENNYEHVYTKGANRWYLSKERGDLQKRFIPFPVLAANYCIFYAEHMYYI